MIGRLNKCVVEIVHIPHHANSEVSGPLLSVSVCVVYIKIYWLLGQIEKYELQLFQ